MYTHILKKSKIRCFRAAWWPSKENTKTYENAYPLMYLETGQVTRVNADNLIKYVPS